MSNDSTNLCVCIDFQRLLTVSMYGFSVFRGFQKPTVKYRLLGLKARRHLMVQGRSRFPTLISSPRPIDKWRMTLVRKITSYSGKSPLLAQPQTLFPLSNQNQENRRWHATEEIKQERNIMKVLNIIAVWNNWEYFEYSFFCLLGMLLLVKTLSDKALIV